MRSPLWILTALALGSANLNAAESVPDTAFVSDANNRMLTHAASGIRFPLQVAGFTRSSEAVFDMRGQYIGVAYNHKLPSGKPVMLRVAVVHIEKMSPREHYAIARPMALRGLTDVRKLTEGSFARPVGGDGYGGLSEGLRSGRPLIIGLWAFDRGYWDVRVRAEFPKPARLQAEAAIRKWVREFRDLDTQYQAPAR